MKKLFNSIVGTGLVGALACIPYVSHAATYHYLDLSGTVQAVEAQSAAGALAQVAARGDSLHSGVALDLNRLDVGDEYGNVYAYTDRAGMRRTVVAATFDAARILATDRAPTSGFVLVGTLAQ